MKDIRREILTQVAAGTLSAEEGAARLDSLEPEAPSSEPSRAPSSPPLPPASAIGRQVRVVSQFGSAEIVGDPSVAFATADGPHRARQDGDTMVIEHESFDDSESFSFGRGSRRIIVNGFDIQRRRLTVRMNPELALVANVQAGNLRIDGQHEGVEARARHAFDERGDARHIAGEVCLEPRGLADCRDVLQTNQ